jgi:hypothetical protein
MLVHAGLASSGHRGGGPSAVGFLWGARWWWCLRFGQCVSQVALVVVSGRGGEGAGLSGRAGDVVAVNFFSLEGWVCCLPPGPGRGPPPGKNVTINRTWCVFAVPFRYKGPDGC